MQVGKPIGRNLGNRQIAAQNRRTSRADFFLVSNRKAMFNWQVTKFLVKIPFAVALGALLWYAITLSFGVTMSSLFLTAKVAGWDWVPMADQPLLWLFTLPLRLLPAAGVALGLNFFSSVLAALTLGLLARSVELLPWDQGVEKSNRQNTALPV